MSRKKDAPEATPRRHVIDSLGPGLVTGAADDDPSGIGTYSQVGAQYGYGMGWTLVLGFPLLASIQAICAEVGAVTGRGIARNLSQHYPRKLLLGAVLLLLVANVINLGADLGAMGAAMALLVPWPALVFTVGFGVLSVFLEVFVSYDRYARVLKWATLSLFAYIAVPFVVGVAPDQALRGLVIPDIALDRDSAMALVAIMGTTISPYLFFWQAAQEVEEQHRRKLRPLRYVRKLAPAEFSRIHVDTVVGMGFSHITALFIMVATAATLHVQGVTEIGSAAQAAEALRPIGGNLAFALFALGMIGTGLLAVPTLAGSAAYAVSETFGWKEGLSRKPREAKAFYGVIAAATLGGIGINLLPLDPMRALYWAAVVNGMLAPPLMLLTMLIARNPKVMGDLVISRRLAIGGWLSTAVMTAVAVLFLAI